MSVQQLQKLMIINKTKQLGWWIRLKSLFIISDDRLYHKLRFRFFRRFDDNRKCRRF